MFPRRLVIGVVVGLLVLGLLMTGISSMQRDAWMQGYLLGRLSTGSDGGTTGQLLPYLYPGYGGPHFGGFGFIFFLGLLFLLFVGLRHFFRYQAWHQQGGPEGGPWGRRGHRPPWWDWDEAPKSKSEQGGPESRSGGGAYV